MKPPWDTMRRRFVNDEYSISSCTLQCGCRVVLLRVRACGHERELHRTTSYREHWAAMYAASNHFILKVQDN